jgi:hypothetical protein
MNRVKTETGDLMAAMVFENNSQTCNYYLK